MSWLIPFNFSLFFKANIAFNFSLLSMFNFDLRFINFWIKYSRNFSSFEHLSNELLFIPLIDASSTLVFISFEEKSKIFSIFFFLNASRTNNAINLLHLMHCIWLFRIDSSIHLNVCLEHKLLLWIGISYKKENFHSKNEK